MGAAAGNQEFEQAGRLRDRLSSVRKAVEKQQMVTDATDDLDVFGFGGDDLETSVQVFYVRRGRVVGRKGFVIDRVEDLTEAQLVGQVIEQHYGEAPLGLPHQVLVPTLPDDLSLYEEYLGTLGDERRVHIRVPQRGNKRALQETVTQNAREEFRRHRMRRAADITSRSRAIDELQEALGLPDAPLRIECFDMSHIQGSDYVGSMVVMEDGLPKPKDYRRFKVKTVQGNDDYAAMQEVLTRRLLAHIAAKESSPEAKSQRFAYPPQLLLVDGGKGQLSVAIKVVEELGLANEIPVAALAKQFEEVFVPGSADPIRIPRQSEALYLLQRIRDEAHRFAITFHRELRGKRMTRSVLDDIAGLGPNRRKRLTSELGGVAGVKRASIDQLRALSWLPDNVATAVFYKVHGSVSG